MLICSFITPNPMRSFLLSLWLVLLGLVLLCPSTPAAGLSFPKGIGIDGKPLSTGGLSISLTTAGYRFEEIPVVNKAGMPAAGFSELDPRISFVASVSLSNRSRAAIPFSFNNAGPRWTFRLVDASGQERWHSDSDIVSAQVITEDVLGPGKTWKLSGRIPLVVDGVPLPAGIYTVQALLNADKPVSATGVIEIGPIPGS